MTRRILVLGATGKTGTRVVAHLTARGAGVVAAVRRPDALVSSTGADLVHFDWDEPGGHAKALAGIDAVYLVPPSCVEDASASIAVFLREAASAGVRRVVLLSSLGVTFADEPFASGRRKHEEAVRESPLAWTILRPSGFFQNFSEGMAQQGIRNDGVIVSATGDGAVALVDASDIAAVAAEALTQSGHERATYALTGPAAVTFAEAARAIGQACGREIVHMLAPPDTLERFLREAGIPDGYRAMLLRDMAAIREGRAAQVSQHIERVTGREPIAIETFVRNAADAWRRS
ncbi:NAD(P)H-binding protein [Paraburkholderia fungorum]|jgi:uncharacterized protein YbjT (DUF2867 family)|uniref:Uncharacterized protein YbjT (DUF2867 family) n=1 Tax=Paraburkholderia fungorum TaxID=134537 RepID=A0AAW3UR86_9BURK|nr:NAD(P)H-binding protein [Paraburkholderia fungorum]MBB4513903.1 uncharacterized protein YbjT (DUF2867 family) [Paraburkholderia fungorum]MBB6201144.1 uncharacterized protein YbjT (DUF2867 family) [Paraburkholderia fungorum]